MSQSATVEISVEELKSKLSSGHTFSLIDVREPWEYEESRIEQSRNIPLHTILDRMSEVGKPDDEIVVYCRTGVRGRTACAVLRQHGFTGHKNLQGGITAYFDSN